MDNTELKQALKDCKKSAKVGYKIALQQKKDLDQALEYAQEKIQDAIVSFDNSPLYTPETSEILETQLQEIGSSFNKLSFSFTDDLKKLHRNLSHFSITLFGRTMAGKSTLMEILTEGNGKSIGKGAERTTLDVRSYKWNGMVITDVPGIAAFNGEDDEKIAFEAARTADLILFLLTDDGPKMPEADFFSRVVGLGKPIVCVMNVKVAIDENKSLKLALRDIKKAFNEARLSAIREQFLEFSKEFGQSWDDIPFAYVHLNAAFRSQHMDDKDIANQLYDASRFASLEQMIINTVLMRGRFYRIKNFIDIISNPILHTFESLLDQSRINYVQWRTISDKEKQFDGWGNTFIRDSKEKVKSFIKKLKSELYGEVAAFAEDHYADKHADTAWKKILESKKIDKRCQITLDEIEERCNDKLKEISREITNELLFVSTVARNDSSLRMNTIIDGKKAWNWTTLIASSGLIISSSVAAFAGAASLATPLGWAAIVVTLIGVGGNFLIKSKDKQENEARRKLEKKLKDNIDAMSQSLQTQMMQYIAQIKVTKIDKTVEEMKKISSAILRLSNIQKDLSWDLDRHLLELNYQLVTEALRIIGAEGLQYHIEGVARVSGNMCLVLPNKETVFPLQQESVLKELIGENINIAYESDDSKQTIMSIIGKSIDSDKIEINEQNNNAVIIGALLTPELTNRVRMAQQYAHILINCK